MSAIVLANSTGNDEVDRVLRLSIDALETMLPGLIRGYYVLGSHASGTALPTSDLDLAFEGHAGDDVQRARAKEVLDACRAATTLDVGVFPVSVDDLGLYNPVFKLRSLFVYGHDIRAALPLLPVEEWARQCMHGIYRVMGRDGRLAAVTYPLDYPDPQGEFYGYVRGTVRSSQGAQVNGTRDLVTGAGWLASALIGLQARRYVLSKGEFATLYHQYIDDEWAPFLDEIYDTCRLRWSYLVPEEPADRRTLRRLCQQYREFENHFLAVYKDFALFDLQSDYDAAALQALRALKHLPYLDLQITAAVEELADCGDQRLQRAAQETLHALHNAEASP